MPIGGIHDDPALAGRDNRTLGQKLRRGQVFVLSALAIGWRQPKQKILEVRKVLLRDA